MLEERGLRMTLNYFEIENLRAFGASTRIALRPLTIFFGRNSVGKSSLLRALPLLADSISSLGHPGLDLRSNAVRGATFAELRSRSGTAETIRFALGWNAKSSDALVELRLSIRELAQTRRQLVEELSAATAAGAQLRAEWLLPESELQGDQNLYLWGHAEQRSERVHIEFDGIKPIVSAASLEPLSEQIAQDVAAVSERLARFARDTHWVGAVRRPPERLQPYRGARRVTYDGGGAAEALAYDELGDGVLLDAVSEWFGKAMNARLRIQRLASTANELFSVILSPIGAPTTAINVCDTGEGVSQVLPVVVLASMCRHQLLGDSPVVLLEQPELHLQPGLHGHVASLLSVAASSCSGARILVETHSGNFLLRLQIEIASGRLSPDDVALYHVDQDDNSGTARVRSFSFDDTGRSVPPWPPGVFSEHVELARELLRTRMPPHEAGA
jgi:hypothetical protein